MSALEKLEKAKLISVEPACRSERYTEWRRQEAAQDTPCRHHKAAVCVSV